MRLRDDHRFDGEEHAGLQHSFAGRRHEFDVRLVVEHAASVAEKSRTTLMP